MTSPALPPPYTNRWRAVPGPNYRRCRAATKPGTHCRKCAEPGEDFCDQHRGRVARDWLFLKEG